jgi:dTDP-4-dehydrorhamnose reductase
MILILGAFGYIGQAFVAEAARRKWSFCPVSRTHLDYTRFDVLVDYLRTTQPAFLINAAGYTGKPNVDECEIHRAETLQGNALFPQTVAHACSITNTPWGHVSSGCIFAGAKVIQNGVARIEKDLTEPGIQALFDRCPASFRGFSETDAPNFSFRQPPCSFYSGTKALAEEALQGPNQTYIWRLRIPFDEFDQPRNYLSKLQRYPKVYNNINSISHRGDFVRACLDLWERRAPAGIYNITNPGFVSTRQVVQMIRQILKPERRFEFWADDAEFYHLAAKAPRSNCVLDVSKLLATGVSMRPVGEALEEALRRWQPAA